MKKLCIVSAGGYGKEIMEVVKDNNRMKEEWDILGFIDDNEELHGKEINGYPVLGGRDWLKERADDESLGCIIAMGDTRIKKKLVEDLEKAGVRFWSVIHHSCYVADFVEIGEGAIVAPECIVTPNAKIGKHVILNMKVVVGHDAVVGDYCILNPGTNIMGGAVIGEGVYIGGNASVRQLVKVGDWSVIGMNAAVVKDIPECVTAVGVPAKPIKEMEKPE